MRTTIGMFGLIAFVAFEAIAVATVMPSVARDLDGRGLYALAFAAPLASGVVGMVVAGMWSDRSGPVGALLTSMTLFSLGLVVCGTAPSMDMLVAGRALQGLGGGGLMVGLYVLVGIAYPQALQPAVFALFSAAWVLPSLFGPAVAAVVASTFGWRWVFTGTVALVAIALTLITPSLRLMQPQQRGSAASVSRLGWALVGASAVVTLELVGSGEGLIRMGAIGALLLVVAALSRLLPNGAMRARRGLPAVVATRGLLSAGFFCAEAYIVYVLQDHWNLSLGRAGIALTLVGLAWAAASLAQSRLGSRLSHERSMRLGTVTVLAGIAAIVVSVAGRAGGSNVSAALPIGAYVVAGAGMGLAYPRAGVAVLAGSSDRDRGLNSAGMTIADSLGAALALAMAGIAFSLAQQHDRDPFLVVFAFAAGVAILAVLTAFRTTLRGSPPG